ncbi:hypothetical protein MJO28_008273 [Puccinia striiformis f. sp. tritici]|uniref:Uncharacterized protein n=3 Tax=Puccinia striiformis TaxID=27350 RepID=A0A0L0VN05_9BASI|nr:uncharacterized protein Pst134EA_031256 [Puccinia striiformis f. sp. tritici]XP_047805400.1 hypothetical protein Pst134EA_015652 [Puccinia striiformis f. sp. tritici]KAI9602625.1 hypothetical protein H4Q26_001916 [Puccinia striiformis f. sp. tritici PST-130]KNF00582.1 hypothetical protein PSTG_06275 [Puccinia striiformis f. sp. tritici PST-78]POW03985.1 hypothetical protein PSHT_11453 [Puccinia striiformis]KAH9443420.1 hypothetical protein Pst134EA_031256 [Puccinia striiformis f. sp. tritic
MSSSIIKLEQTHQDDDGGFDKLDLMPFSIDYHGPAEISKYFITKPIIANQTYEASFRGRYLHGTQLTLPLGYSGLVLSSSKDNSELVSPTITTTTTTSIVRGRGRGRARGRAGRGRKLGQAGGNRVAVTRNQAKRKISESTGFLDSDEEEEDDDKKLKTGSSAQDPILTEPSHSLINHQQQQQDEQIKPTIITQPSVQEPTNTDPDHKTILKSVGRFDRFTIWNPDHQLDLSQDVYARAITEWIDLSNLLHDVPSS